MDAARHFGFELDNGTTVQVVAGDIHSAMDEAEARYGSRVSRGRCLDEFDNLAPANRPPWLIERTPRPIAPAPQGAQGAD